MQEKVLITGGGGFVGSNLVSDLLVSGAEVRVLDNFSRGVRAYLDDFDIEIIEADITMPNQIEAAFEGIDKVVHLAAFGSVVESVDDPRSNFQMNVVGTFNVLNQCVKYGIGKIVFSSTGGALIGNAEPPVSEQSLPKPISPYGASKLCCEAYCQAYSQSYDIEAICLRFANVYGPNSYHKTGVVNKFFHAVKNNEPLTIFGDGTSSRDYIHVSDLANGITLALQNDSLGSDVIHLAAGREVSLNELAETVKVIAGKPEHTVKYFPARKGEVDRNFAKYDYANKVLGFKPKVTLKDGLQALWDTYPWGFSFS